MAQKRTEKIEQTYHIDQSEILSLMDDIPKSLNCSYILIKGKRKGQLCNAFLCPHHNMTQEFNDEQLVAAIEESIMYTNVNASRIKQGIAPIRP